MVFVQTAASLLCIAPPQLNSIGATTRLIGNTTVYNGKRVFATDLAFVFPSPGFRVDGLPRLVNSLTSEPCQIQNRELFRCRAPPFEIKLSGHRPSGSMSFEPDLGNSIIVNLESRGQSSELQPNSEKLKPLWDYKIRGQRSEQAHGN